MKRFFSIPSLVVILLGLLALPAFAQNESVLDVHLNNAVAIPGNVLSPGDYIFHLLESPTGQAIVQVQSADGKASYGFIQVISAKRDEIGDSLVTVKRSDETRVARIDSWYFPGTTSGYQFVYSKPDLRKLDTIAQKMHLTTTAGM